MKYLIASISIILGLCAGNLISDSAYADLSSQDLNTPPAEIIELQNIQRETFPQAGEETQLPLNIKEDAQKEAAFSYGARGGLAWQTYYIRKEMETRSRYMDKVFDFRQLLIPAPSGTLIEPPIVSEALDALLISNRGEQAAVADKILRINRNARIVSAPRTWRTYLEREWGQSVEPPPDILRPENNIERALWREWVQKGWDKGVEQADEIFKADLDRLVADYQGMVRYKILLAQGLITPPFALQVDRGVTGDGNVMRIGDRAVEITEMPRLQSGFDKWSPASR
ncbi:MAG: type IV secretion system DotC family protein [Pseudomonadota bacterium]